MAKATFKITLSDTNVYLYKTYVLREPARGWRRVLCCARSFPPQDTDAVSLFADWADIDHTWAVMLLGVAQYEM